MLAEVPRNGGRQHEVDLVDIKALEEAAQESKVIFELADNRYDR